jgi:hypothetical protein
VLRALLNSFKHEQLRPSFDLLQSTIRDTFGCECNVSDLLAAIGCSDQQACCVEPVPWPIARKKAEEASDQGVAASLAVYLTESQNGAGPWQVFPPYEKALERVVEEEYSSSLISEVSNWIRQEGPKLEGALCVPQLLLHANNGPGQVRNCSGGVLIWCFEKTYQDSSIVPISPGVPQLQEPVVVPPPSRSAEASLQKSAKGKSKNSTPTSLTPKADDDDDDEEDDDGGDDDDDDANKDDGQELTPEEAFIECFKEDLLAGRPLFLSQLNNLYKMRSGGREIPYKRRGYSRMREFLQELPGLQLLGAGNHMEVRLGDQAAFHKLASEVSDSLQKRIDAQKQAGEDSGALEVNFSKPQAVPKKLLNRLWDLFQTVPQHEIPVNTFVSVYKQHYSLEKLRFKALGYQDVRGLMAQVPFIEKVGGRRNAKYVLKADGGGWRPHGNAGGSPHGASSSPQGGMMAMPQSPVGQYTPGAHSNQGPSPSGQSAKPLSLATYLEPVPGGGGGAWPQSPQGGYPQSQLMQVPLHQGQRSPQQAWPNQNWQGQQAPEQLHGNYPRQAHHPGVMGEVDMGPMSVPIRQQGWNSNHEPMRIQAAQGPADPFAMHLREDIACIVCDFNSNKLHTANALCDALLQGARGSTACKQDLSNVIAPKDREKMKACITYVQLSERPSLDRVKMTLQAFTGDFVPVEVEGQQIEGSLWRLIFHCA